MCNTKLIEMLIVCFLRSKIWYPNWMGTWASERWFVKERLIDSAPGQRKSSQSLVCKRISSEQAHFCVRAAFVFAKFRLLRFLFVPKSDKWIEEKTLSICRSDECRGRALHEKWKARMQWFTDKGVESKGIKVDCNFVCNKIHFYTIWILNSIKFMLKI